MAHEEQAQQRLSTTGPVASVRASTAGWCKGRSLVLLVGVLLCVAGGAGVSADVAFADRPPEVEAGELNVGEENFTQTSVGFYQRFTTGGLESHWKFEYATSEGGPWSPVPGGSGTVPAETIQHGDEFEVKSELTGLTPEAVYYVRFQASNMDGATAPLVTRFETVTLHPRTGSAGTAFNVTGSSAGIHGGTVIPDNFETSWHYEYAPAEAGHAPAKTSAAWKLSPGAEGVISAAEANEEPHSVSAALTGLSPASTYYVRLIAKNEHGTASSEESGQSLSFVTAGPPTATTFAVHSVHGEALRALGSVDVGVAGLNEVQTVTIGGAPTGGTFTLSFKGQTTGATTTGDLTAGSNTVALARAATGTGTFTEKSDVITGIETATGAFQTGQQIYTEESSNGYNVLLSSNIITAVSGSTITLSSSTVQIAQAPGRHPGLANTVKTSFFSYVPSNLVEGETFSGSGIPAGTTIVSLPENNEVELSQTATATAAGVTLTAELPFDTTRDAVGRALDQLSSVGNGVRVEGPPGGPFTVEFDGPNAGIPEPQITGDGSGLTPSSPSDAVTVTTGTEGGGESAHYHFEYVTQAHFEAEGFANAASTPEVELPAPASENGGYATRVVGEDLPGLQSGTTYRYRLSATNSTLGNPVVDGSEQTLTVPPSSSSEEPTCPNEPLRTGLAARLPDCRAYELVTPSEKGGTKDIDTYGQVENEPLVGEDGEHFFLRSPGTQWGSSPDSKAASYFFTRTPSGWRMTSTTPPEAGSTNYIPQLFTPDLTQTDLDVGWQTTSSAASPMVELESGPPGGPYATFASIPRADDANGEPLAGSSADNSKIVIQTSDHTLLGYSTGTTSGNDLYEWSGGELRQVNVSPTGGKISNCGAKLVTGAVPNEVVGDPNLTGYQNPQAVSAEGSRVFFEDNCNHHLYMRVDGERTVDIGEYTFLAANGEGSQLLLQKSDGGEAHVVLYEVESETPQTLLTLDQSGPIGPTTQRFVASDELTVFYFGSVEQLPGTEAPPPEGKENIYRYDIATKTLSFVVQTLSVADDVTAGGYSMSPDGSDFYFASSEVPGVPGGGVVMEGGASSVQVYRYDSTENVVQCMSCASSFNPEPKLSASWLFGQSLKGDAVPALRIASANGDYVFFDTTAALVPQDVDGEIAPSTKVEDNEFTRSPSSDTYEWRRDRVDGCGRIDGCVSLISGGRGGLRTELLGTTPSGDDVFFATHEALVAQDTDKAGDVYDARIGGGFPPPAPGPTECEGDACSAPFSPPGEVTPSSSTFHGAGDVASEAGPSSKATKAKKKPKAKAKLKKKRKRKQAAKKGKRASRDRRSK